MDTPRTLRRGFLRGSGLLLLGACGSDERAGKKDGSRSPEAELSPTEDLMREHGLLNRILLVYEEFIRRLDMGAELDPQKVLGAAGILRKFVEDYHERLEEDYLFPRFLKAKRLVELVVVLRAQHEAGRRLTAKIQDLAQPAAWGRPETKKKLSSELALFVRMYRPHEAREDTVLFPALRDLASAKELEALGEDFEKKEHALFGQEGFEGMVEKTAEIEKSVGIYNLAQFTPPT
ncbi:MAG TPA: hemerythrin domain-containing protein [Planctomycetota bacterium]|nr:hemerythrin domain-containing protein [Planctomycetota bacterium]